MDGFLMNFRSKNHQEPPRTNTEQGTQMKIKNTNHKTAFHIVPPTANKRTPRNGTCTKRGAAVSLRMAPSVIEHTRKNKEGIEKQVPKLTKHLKLVQAVHLTFVPHTRAHTPPPAASPSQAPVPSMNLNDPCTRPHVTLLQFSTQ